MGARPAWKWTIRAWPELSIRQGRTVPRASPRPATVPETGKSSGTCGSKASSSLAGRGRPCQLALISPGLGQLDPEPAPEAGHRQPRRPCP